MNQDNISIRLKLFMDSQGLTNSQFADSCGIPRPSLSQLLSGRNKKISDVLVGQIHRAFPNLSVLWLMFGEGDMLHNGNRSAGSYNDTDSPHSDSIFSDSLFDENKEFPMAGHAPTEYVKEKGLNMVQNRVSPGLESRKIDELERQNLLNEIEYFKKNPRRVSQITIYYDDSTFETFYPRK